MRTFTLRTLLLVVVFASLVLGWVSHAHHASKRAEDHEYAMYRHGSTSRCYASVGDKLNLSATSVEVRLKAVTSTGITFQYRPTSQRNAKWYTETQSLPYHQPLSGRQFGEVYVPDDMGCSIAVSILEKRTDEIVYAYEVVSVGW